MKGLRRVGHVKKGQSVFTHPCPNTLICDECMLLFCLLILVAVILTSYLLQFIFDWSTLDAQQSEVARSFLNEAFTQTELPSFIGDLAITGLE